jgi:hypothetical protein
MDCATGQTVIPRGTKRRANNASALSDDSKSAATTTTLEGSDIVNVKSAQDLIKRLKKELQDVKLLEEKLCDGPVLVAQLNEQIWKTYCELEENNRVPLELRFLHQQDGNLFIIELPTKIHEHYAEEICLQMVRVCPYITSFGAGTSSHKEADKFLLPRPNCPNAVFPENAKDCATVIVEIGLSQRWDGITGLDMKANFWFNSQSALEYIICVKIEKHKISRQVKSLTYKVYDIAVCNGVFPLHNPPVSFTVGNNHHIILDARRVLRIPQNIQLPAGCPDQFLIDLAEIRADSIAFGL